jgi:hypothetical protein
MVRSLSPNNMMIDEWGVRLAKARIILLKDVKPKFALTAKRSDGK